jgi:hypothetical protein
MQRRCKHAFSITEEALFSVGLPRGYIMRISRYIQAGMPQSSVMYPRLYSLYINDTNQTTVVYLGFFVDDTCIYETDRKEGYILRKLQRGLSAGI